jgi:hypothetical protein
VDRKTEVGRRWAMHELRQLLELTNIL